MLPIWLSDYKEAECAFFIPSITREVVFGIDLVLTLIKTQYRKTFNWHKVLALLFNKILYIILICFPKTTFIHRQFFNLSVLFIVLLFYNTSNYFVRFERDLFIQYLTQGFLTFFRLHSLRGPWNSPPDHRLLLTVAGRDIFVTSLT